MTSGTSSWRFSARLQRITPGQPRAGPADDWRAARKPVYTEPAGSLTVSDETFALLTRLAESAGKEDAVYLAELIAAAWESACAPYDAAFDGDETWLAGAQEALDEIARGEARHFASTEEFAAHLDSASVAGRESELPLHDSAHAAAR